ncbi:MAG: glycosyl transferase [Oscillospiraceae bacterium]|nr:glycosyl transferase [Oscillospiraceae bacterium]
MKVVQINTFGVLSTGRIAADLYRTLVEHGHEGLFFYGRENVADDIESVNIGSKMGIYLHVAKTRLWDKHGFGSVISTQKMIKKIKEYQPDIIHLHNLHGYYLNIELLFNFLREYDKPVIWTLHDCWPFTGHCAYFDLIGCDKWLTQCENCGNKKEYPKSLLMDRSKKNFIKKKELFTSVKNMTIVTPSVWLKELVQKSFLGRFPVKVIHNGIDLDKFRPTQSDFKTRYGLEKKIIILGVASVWSDRKGLDDFISLSNKLDDLYQIVLVGVDKKQIQSLPQNIIGISRTHNIEELAGLYSVADVFVNPTYEDNFPTTNLEALACGTPVITYRTGGSVESIDESCGIIIEQGNIDCLAETIKNIQSNDFSSEDCLERSKKYDKKTRFKEYLSVYEEITQ